MDSSQHTALPPAPKLAFADLHQPENIEDYTLEIYGASAEAESGNTTSQATTQLEPTASAFVPSSVAAAAAPPEPSLNPQATSFHPHPLPPPHQSSGPPPAPKPALARRADVLFKSDSFHALSALALQRAVLPAPTTRPVPPPGGPPPNNWTWKREEDVKSGSRAGEPLQPYWLQMLERFRLEMVKLIWESEGRREWFAWRVGGGEGDAKEELERGIRGAQEFVLREVRREWIAVLGE